MYSTSSSSESTDTNSCAIIELESRDEVNPVAKAKEESRGDSFLVGKVEKRLRHRNAFTGAPTFDFLYIAPRVILYSFI